MEALSPESAQFVLSQNNQGGSEESSQPPPASQSRSPESSSVLPARPNDLHGAGLGGLIPGRGFGPCAHPGLACCVTSSKLLCLSEPQLPHSLQPGEL